jgi:hypothetical protein
MGGEFFSTFRFVGKTRRCRFHDEERDTVYVFEKGDYYYIGSKIGGLTPVPKEYYEDKKEEIKRALRMRNGQMSIRELDLAYRRRELYPAFVIGLVLGEWKVSGWGRKRIVKLVN